MKCNVISQQVFNVYHVYIYIYTYSNAFYKIFHIRHNVN